MIRRILLILAVLAVPAGLASASQALADSASPPTPHQQPIVVQLDVRPQTALPSAQPERGGEDG
ncbi:hypothetical protein CQ019_13355 [Arthrobacter sp. MYb229]|uniref:hypothetical protein n=1 Tax=unclassified Arthrobacter TaxID=235627 RepID=UPI000CFB6EB0|nr:MULTISPECIES: hypothetical protein [unclassified Arthrobacter]PRA02445.1 hypothetical protein CQ019_13355 [Arthrobacter sp. MYb229]PRB50612.1 hypothetical protein CQ013_11470 [Arthrobacter sp. MYb216]